MTTIGLEQLATWKHGAMTAYQTAFVRLLCECGPSCADDLPDTARPADGDRQSVPGNALRALRMAHVIDYADDVHNPAAGIFHGRKRSSRVECKGREVRYYRAIYPMAREWLARNGVDVPTDGQMRMAL